MNNLPAGADLLTIAREALLAELRPLLGTEARYIAAMIANAMAIAVREAQAGEAPARTALARLEALHGAPPSELNGDALRQAITAHERRLATDIRAGRYDTDGGERLAVIGHLRESVLAKLRISNPKALDDGALRGTP